MRSPLARTLGKTIREHRKLAGISQAELAATFVVTQSTVSKWELGWLMPDVPTLLRVAALLGFSVDDLKAVAA